jgi:hypothetical protein
VTTLLAAPALPLHTAGKYVAAAYIVFFALILIYVAIMAARVSRIERDLGELLERTADAASMAEAQLERPAGERENGLHDEAPATAQTAIGHSAAVPEESARV